MKSVGADALAELMRPARARLDDLAAIGEMPISEAAVVMLEQCDAITMQTTGTKCSPDRLRDLASQAEALAAEYRRIAAEREREAS